MGESSLRREPGVELHGAPRLAIRIAVGPTCGGERQTLQPRGWGGGPLRHLRQRRYVLAG